MLVEFMKINKKEVNVVKALTWLKRSKSSIKMFWRVFAE